MLIFVLPLASLVYCIPSSSSIRSTRPLESRFHGLDTTTAIRPLRNYRDSHELCRDYYADFWAFLSAHYQTRREYELQRINPRERIRYPYPPLPHYDSVVQSTLAEGYGDMIYHTGVGVVHNKCFHGCEDIRTRAEIDFGMWAIKNAQIRLDVRFLIECPPGYGVIFTTEATKRQQDNDYVAGILLFLAGKGQFVGILEKKVETEWKPHIRRCRCARLPLLASEAVPVRIADGGIEEWRAASRMSFTELLQSHLMVTADLTS